MSLVNLKFRWCHWIMGWLGGEMSQTRWWLERKIEHLPLNRRLWCHCVRAELKLVLIWCVGTHHWILLKMLNSWWYKCKDILVSNYRCLNIVHCWCVGRRKKVLCLMIGRRQWVVVLSFLIVILFIFGNLDFLSLKWDTFDL